MEKKKLSIPQLVLIPEGYFLMGSDDGEETEKPQRRVWLDAYYIGKYEITNAEYAEFLERTNYHPPEFWFEYKFNKPKQPIVGLNWKDAMEYCRWLSQMTGEDFRLPTEAEWEKAARGIDGRSYPWGEGIEPAKANYGRLIGEPTPVGRYPQGVSPYGCFDMSGNVWEWCWDWYDENYYKNAADKNPEGPEYGDWKVLRGGSWDSRPENLRCFCRNLIEPITIDAYMGAYVGFRVAKTMSIA
jgi:iron(II)-dependent oxidoreductase